MLLQLEVEKFRRGCGRSDAKRDAGLKTPADIMRLDAIPYGPNGWENTLDVYYPKGTNGKLPTIVCVHGGGYIYGGTKQYQFYCMALAQQGFAVVNFNYRLAPGSKFPTPLLDANTVLQWMAADPTPYHFDMNNVFLVGDSAGAQLASQYAAIYANPAYAKVMGILPPDFRLAAVGLHCGMYDLVKLFADSTPTQDDLVKLCYFGENMALYGEKLRVLDYINADYPPCYILSAPGDFLREHAQPMADLLTARGVENVCRLYGDETTGHVFHLNIRTPLAQQANGDVVAFFKMHIL